MKLISSSFQNNGRIPAEFAFCAPDPKTHVTLSQNRNPDLAWSDVPAATKNLSVNNIYLARHLAKANDRGGEHV